MVGFLIFIRLISQGRLVSPEEVICGERRPLVARKGKLFCSAQVAEAGCGLLGENRVR